jgi:uncharacterized protein YceK
VRRLELLVVGLCLISGCGTIATKARPVQAWGCPYSGVEEDARVMLATAPVGFWLLVTDLPLSLIADTVVLPADLVMVPKHGCNIEYRPAPVCAKGDCTETRKANSN